MRKCTKCKSDKPVADFPFKDKQRGIRSSICSECQREYKRDYYYRNKEAHYERNRKTSQKLKEYMLSRKDRCIVCGEDERVCLDFHHIKDKDTEIAKLIKLGSLKRIKKEIDKCVVLCANCHRKVHAGMVKLAS